MTEVKEGHEGAAAMIQLDAGYDECGRWHKPRLSGGAWRGCFLRCCLRW